ncbi:hypothetical protein [Corynebacterium variabile]|uniref:hypothetical protein n=1 Tax=Corynebacterium variabile TaxID=1727 RepID=UPI00289F521F|nr:hypothetical protein [Corynebacterium variabile]
MVIDRMSMNWTSACAAAARWLFWVAASKSADFSVDCSGRLVGHGVAVAETSLRVRGRQSAEDGDLCPGSDGPHLLHRRDQVGDDLDIRYLLPLVVHAGSQDHQ